MGDVFEFAIPCHPFNPQIRDLLKLADKGKGISTGVLTLIFGNANPQDVALAFLASDKHDPEVEKKTATKELLGFLQNAYDIEFPAKTTLAGARGAAGSPCSAHGSHHGFGRRGAFLAWIGHRGDISPVAGICVKRWHGTGG